MKTKKEILEECKNNARKEMLILFSSEKALNNIDNYRDQFQQRLSGNSIKLMKIK